MRTLVATIGLLALTATLAAAQTSSGTLTGKMAPFNYLFGAAWNCTANVPAMAGKPAHTDTSTVAFDAAPANVMHVRVSSSQYSADQYFGYSTQGNVYWSATSDSMGAAAAEISSDGKTYKGTMSMGPMNGTVQDTYTKTADNKVAVHSVATVAGKSNTTDVNCSR